jgi:protein tyrosine phosphatase (PTP) superfamily phosphohydrolase (DUF442 family)
VHARFALGLGLVFAAVAACAAPAPLPAPPPDAEPGSRPTAPASSAARPAPAAPVAWSGKAYDAALSVTLAKTAPEEHPDLHNVYRLSDNIISGSEPHGEEALKRIAAMGVKTILSVDGKTPDAEIAAKHGMKYVHVPIQYKGITPEEIAEMAKTFRELPGPFYVHCFHGKHRGPAGAAVGRLVLDGASREQAAAEMRQWCGTSPKYEGLYATILGAPMPTEAETRGLAFSFPSTVAPKGLPAAMSEIARTWDNLALVQKGAWAADPAHPDVDPVNEGEKLAQYFAQANGLETVTRRPPDFQGWMHDSVQASAALEKALKDLRGGDAGARERADEALKVVKARCDSCHAKYRD